MAIEVEVKMRLDAIVGADEIVDRLRQAGATCHGTVLETNTFFDTPDRSLREHDCGLRIRTAVDESGQSLATMTYKGARAPGPVKRRTEHETRIGEPRQAASLLESLGYGPVQSFEKRRQTWTLEACHIELDTLPHLGRFLEIEGPDDRTVLALRERLGLTDLPLITTSYIAMLVDDQVARGVSDPHIRF